jgi:hypothetical protein
VGSAKVAVKTETVASQVVAAVDRIGFTAHIER